MLQLWFVANTVLWPIVIMLGGLHLGLNVVVLSLVGIAWLAKKRRIAVTSANVLLALLAYFIFSLIVAVAGPCTDTLPKLLITVPILLFLALVGLEVGRRARDIDWLNLRKAATWVLMAAFSAFLLEMAFPSWFPEQAKYRFQGRFSGLFSEPSHVAFSLFPCIAVLLVDENKQMRRRGLLALAGLLVFSRSSTLIAFVAAWLLYRLLIQRKLRRASLVALGVGLVIVLGSAINYDLLIAPTLGRIVGVAASSETDNVSSLVYVQGWEDAWANIARTHGLGLGFNMMGCHPLPSVSARAVLALEGLEDLNAPDGSFLFGKVVSEAGVAGVAFYVAIIWWWVRLGNDIRAAPDDIGRAAASIQSALIFCFVASSFIRSTGYFNQGILLWIVAVSGASKCQERSVSKLASILQSQRARMKRAV